MSANRASIKCRLSYILLAAFIVVIIVLIFALKGLDSKIAEIAEIKCREQAECIINSAVEDTLSKTGNISLYKVSEDEKGLPVSAEIDPAAANAVKTMLLSKVNESMSELSREGFDIPIGTLTGLALLSGKGSGINIDVMQIGTADSSFDSSFEEAGINNVKLKVTVNVTVRVRMILPTGSRDITAEGEYLIAEAVFIGEAPNMYF